MFRVGISEVDITPPLGLRMSGMLLPPKAEGVVYPLMGRTVVFDDGIDQIAIVSLDLLFLLAGTVAELRQALSIGSRLKPEHILITCSHTHRGPFTTSLMDEEVDFSYIDLLREKLVVGMVQAQAALQPAELWVGKTDAPGWAFNRRPIYRTVLGEQVGTQGPVWGENFIGMEAPEDNELKILAFRSPQGKMLGGLVNFTCHPTVMGAEPVYSADYCGALTETLAKRHGGIFAFLQGAAGNQWCINMAKYDPSRKPVDADDATPKMDLPFREMGPEHAVKMGTALADKFDEALQTSRKLPGRRVLSQSTVLRIPQRRPTLEQVELAKWYLEKRQGDIDQTEFTRKHYGHEFTFYHNDAIVQEWFMREAIGMWEWQKRCGQRELIEEVEVHTLAVDDVAFAGFPAEYFSEFGVRLKANSPFADTFVIELANGQFGYVPTKEAFAHGGYEPRLGYQSRLIEEAGDRMLSAALILLEELARKQALA